MTKVETPHVLRTDDGPVRTLTLNRGERFNPLSSAMIATLQAELDAVATNEFDTGRRPRCIWPGLLRRPRSQRVARPCG